MSTPLIILFFILLDVFVLFFSLLMSGINSFKTKKNASFSGIALHIKDINVIILLPIDFALPDMCHFLKVFLTINPHIHDLSFLDTTTSTKSFTPPIPTYTPSLPISTPPPHVSLINSSPSFVNVTTTDTLLLLTALTSRGDQLSCRNSPRDCHSLARYCVFVNATYSLEFSSFVFAHHSLQESKSYSEDVKSPE